MTARTLLVAGLGLSLSGCFLPTPVSLVSTGVDVVSFVATGKAATDHGLSLAMGEDCALIRLFEGAICREPRIYEPVAAGVPLEPLPSEADQAQLAEADPEVQAAIERAAAHDDWDDDLDQTWTANWASGHVQVALLPGGFMADDLGSIASAPAPASEAEAEGESFSFATLINAVAASMDSAERSEGFRLSDRDRGR